MNGKGPSLVFRCILALVLMVGFYLLAIAIAWGLLYIPYAELKYAERLHIKLALICVFSAGAIVWSVLPRADKFTPPGPKLTPERHPRLFRELKTISDAMREGMPVEVYLVPDVNAWVCNRGGVMGFGSRRVMGLGLPLLRVLNVSQLRAVLAHEFGHYHGGETALAPWVYKTRSAIMRTLASLQGGAIQKPFLWYGKMFLRITHAVSRQQEYAADALAAQFAGAISLTTGLQKIHGAAHAFDAYWSSEVAPVLSAGFRPPIAEGFAAFLSSEPVSQGTAALLGEELASSKQDPYDTHPSLKDRLAALQDVVTTSVPGDDAPAMSLLEDETATEAQLLAAVFAQHGGRPLREITWQDTLSLVYLPVWTRQAGQHADSLAGIQLKDLPDLVKCPDQLVARFLKSIGPSVPDENKGPTAAAIIGAATAVVLHNHGLSTRCEVGLPVQMHSDGAEITPPIHSL